MLTLYTLDFGECILGPTGLLAEPCLNTQTPKPKARNPERPIQILRAPPKARAAHPASEPRKEIFGWVIWVDVLGGGGDSKSPSPKP